MDAPRDPEKVSLEAGETGVAKASRESSVMTQAVPGSGPDSGSGAEQAAIAKEEEQPAAAAAAAAAAPQDDIPDGGLVAWLQVLGSWVILVDTWGLVNSFGVFQTYYETEMLASSSSSAISWIGSLQASLMMLVGVVSGPLYDMGYFRHLLAVGLFLIVFGQFMVSLSTTYWHVLLAQGVAQGIGMGLTFLPSTAILAQYFRRRRALAIGISSTGSPVAGTLIPILFSRLQPRVGFAWATRSLAFILLAVSVVPLVCMRTRVPPPPRRRSVLDPTALRDGAYVAHVLAAFFAFLVLYVPYFYLQLFAEKHGLAGPDLSPYVVTMLNAASVIGRVLPNHIADYAGSVNVVIGCAVASAALLLGWFGISGSFGGLVAFALLFGGFSGGIVSITPSVIMALTPDPGRLGARMGMSFTCTGVAILIGTPIAGAIVAGFEEDRWRGVIGYSAGSLFVAIGFYLTCRFLLYRRNGKWKA